MVNFHYYSNNCAVSLTLRLAAPYLKLPVDASAVQSVTRGLVGDTAFAVHYTTHDIRVDSRCADRKFLQITPKADLISLTTFQPALIKLFLRPTWSNFVATTTLCAYASFLFGWHVHEKAILLVIIPFSLIALNDRRHLGAFRPLAVAGHVSLFPLLFTASEFPVKVAYTIFWLMAFLLAFDRLAPA
jgi:alpha-1,3-glucosyltransferase